MRILHNATIYTLNQDQPVVEAMAIEKSPEGFGRVLAAGTRDEVQAEFGHKAEIEDLDGATVLPGLTDAHLHLQQYALSLQMVDCDTATQAECLERVAQKASTSKPGEWIRGHGWRQGNWPEGFGSAAMLDRVAPDNPVYLTAASLHAGWANRAALRAAGIDEHTPNPKNGEITRDGRGAATGILLEAAMALVADAIPKASEDEVMRALRVAQGQLWALGLTGVHNFDRRLSLAALQRLHQAGELQLRVLSHLPVEALKQALEIGLRSGLGDDMLRIGSIKVFADGALGPRTAAMLEAYEGEPDNRGMLFVDGEELFEIASQAAQGGLAMTVHAIGDRANHEVLNAFEQLRQFEREQQLPHYRHRIEHVQVLHPDDLGRLADLDLIASMQPIHATADMEVANKFWGARCATAYAWRAQLEAGARLAFGSDAPVESPNPFWGLHAAVTRRRQDGSPGAKGWFPEQKLTLREALLAFTHGPAYAAWMEDRLGKLKPGYLADLVLLESDPFELPPQDLQHLKPKGTMVGGRWVLLR